jgi:PAS domain S-box-containing protein
MAIMSGQKAQNTQNTVALVSLGIDGRITDANEATVRMTGLARQRLLGSRFSDLFAEPEKAQEGFKRVLAEGSVLDYPLTMRDSDGRLRDINYSAVAYRNARGAVLGVIATGRDVTERKRAELDRQRLAMIVESSEDAIIAKDLNGFITSWNRSAEKMFGYTAREAIGGPIGLIVPPERSAEELALRKKVALGGPVSQFETERARKDGTRLPVSLSFSPIRDPLGRIVGVSAIMRDMTERNEAEEKLRAASAYARSLIEASPDPLVTISPQGKITDVNEATIKATGVARHELIGSDFSDYFTEPGKAREGYRRVFSEGFVTDYALTIRGRNGRLTNVLYNATLYRDARGTVLGVFAAARDVTENAQLKKAAEEIRVLNGALQRRAAELEGLNKELEAFSYSVSHDLRAPLRAIDGFGQALEEDYSGLLDEEGRRYLMRMRVGARQMGLLIDDMLKLSRLTRMEVSLVEVDLSAIAGEVAADLMREQGDRSVEFVIPPGVIARGDARLLRIALENLFENAWKFTATHPRARIEFGVRGEGKKTYFVRDDGVGFDMAYAGKLFGAFQRLHSSQEFPGTGIGLATVQRVIGKHGGRVWVEAEPGRGATFYFTLE